MLSELQKRKLTVVFHHHDTNENGFLEKADYEQFVTKFGQAHNYTPDSPKYKAFYGQTMAAWDHVQKVADRNKDGRVSLEEFLESYDITLSNKDLFEQLVIGYGRSVLVAWDRDGDGRLSVAEYLALMGCYGVSEKLAREAFRRLDRDANGYLTVEELMQNAREFYGDDPDAPGNWMMGPY